MDSYAFHYADPGFVGAVLVSLSSVVVFAIPWVIGLFRNRQRFITYALHGVTPLLVRPMATSRVEVRAGDGTSVAEPHIAHVSVEVMTRQDIVEDRFGGKPLAFEFDAKPLEILETRTLPPEQNPPLIAISGSGTLDFGPGRLYRRHSFAVEVLTDGRVTKIRPHNPISEVDLREQRMVGEDRSSGGTLKRSLTWGAIAILVFFLAYKPASATAVFRSIAAGLSLVGGFFSHVVSA